MKKTIFLLLVLFIVNSYCFAQLHNMIDNPEYIIYIPTGIDYNQRYPLVIILSPDASLQSMIYRWKGIADEYKWIIFGSKEFKNGIDINAFFSHFAGILDSVFIKFPIDKSKIIATGLSGGGMGSHAFAFLYPELVYAVVINTGMINKYYIEQKHMYPKGKIAVFLASPTDFRYEEMKQDRIFLESLGWKTKWIEFQGGHTMAPESSYKEAANWLQEQF